MRKKHFLLVSLILICKALLAQDTCTNPILLNTSVYTGTATINTPQQNGPFYSCLGTAANPYWMEFEVCNTGSIYLDIIPGSSGMDLDAIIWGPYPSPGNCLLDSAHVADCDFNTTVGAQLILNSATSGDFYTLCITNFSNTPGSFSVEFNNQASSGNYCGTNPCNDIIHNVCRVSKADGVDRNEIVFEKYNTQGVDHYEIQRETSTAMNFITIGSLSPTDSSYFIDTTVFASSQVHRYRISTVDTCGNPNISSPHSTFHLQTSLSGSGFPQLHWSNYEGFPYSTIYIYRNSNPTNLILLDSISSLNHSYTDLFPLSGTNFYQIAAFPADPCTPSRAQSTENGAFSNYSQENIVSIPEIPLISAVYPNPAKNILNVETFDSPDEAIVTDITGRIIYHASGITSNNFQINLGNPLPGLYFLRVKSGLNQQIVKFIIE